ncbi:hypothetical protein [uncultured Winogradskyella sp.]|uniref:hypothetical protein n=1 Tax=uncultured Winogradskyella sp. TaxID=395353 RepID=UPI00260D5241|nr:hypothetical protein [uncultured Winogradskyella sp.]
MRTDNRNVKNKIISIYFLLLVTAILLATVFKSYDAFPKASMYVFLGFFIVVLFVHFIARYFEYDSDGAKLVITNKGLILTDFINYRQKKIEFAKHKLVSYKVYNYLIYKILVVSIQNSNGKTYDEHFNITLFKRRKLKYVKQSLKRIIKQNIKHKRGVDVRRT